MKKRVRGKKILIILLAAATVMSIVACGDEKQASSNTSGSTGEAKAAVSGERGALAFEPYEEELRITLGRLASRHTAASMYDGDTFENNPYTRYVTEKLNISFEDVIEADGEDYKKQIALATASGDLPDMFTVTDYNQLIDLVENDMIYDMTEIYEQYASDYIRDIYDSYEGRCLSNVTFEGRLMALPGSNPDNGVPILCWIRKDWMDQLNLNPDKDGDLCITVQDIEDVASAFVKADISGKGTIGIAMADSVGDGEWLYEGMGGYADKWMKNADGTIGYTTFTNDAVKESWILLNKWFSEGILDPQFGTRTFDDITSLMINNQCGISFGAWHTPDWRLTHVKDANPETEYIAYTIEDEEGFVNVYHENAASSYVVVRKDFEFPEAAVKILNVVFGDLATATNETAPEVMQFVRDGGDNFCRPFQIEVLPANNPVNYYIDHMAVLNKEITPEEASTSENKNTAKAMLQYLENPENVTAETSAGWKAYNSRIIGSGASVGAMQKNDNAKWISPLYPPTLPVMEQKKTTIDTMELQAYIKIVTGAEPIAYFDEFKAQWHANGGQEIIDELEEYYRNNES